MGIYLDKNGLSRLKEKIAKMIADRAITWGEITGKPSTFTPSSHTHTKSQISDFPVSLKNPNALTIKLNGNTQGAYDGSAAKDINITAAGIGAALASHSHNYAGSSSAGGSANSATKLDSSAGSVTQPVYFSGGKPVVCSYTLGASVPSGAKFTDTTYGNMGPATASAAGKAGLVPAPGAGKQLSFLRGDGTWVVPTNTTYSPATVNAAGLMSAADKSKLDNIAAGANKYTHPTYTARTNGLYKVTVDATGHVSAVAAVTKADITALGIPAQDTNTTYGLATQNANGLFSAVDKKKLDGVAAGANAYSHPSTHAASMIQVTIGSSVVSLSDVISCAIFKIAEDDDSVEFGNINEWLAAGKPKL